MGKLVEFDYTKCRKIRKNSLGSLANFVYLTNRFHFACVSTVIDHR